MRREASLHPPLLQDKHEENNKLEKLAKGLKEARKIVSMQGDFRGEQALDGNGKTHRTQRKEQGDVNISFIKSV